MTSIQFKEFKICYCLVTLDEIPRFARNDKAFVVYTVDGGWFGGVAAKPAPINCRSTPNPLSF